MESKKTISRRPSMKFIASSEKAPKVEIQAGMKFKVEAIELVDATLKPIKKGAARLCGGTSTCLALIDIEDLEML